MPKVMKVCRVCGKSYEACRTVNKVPGIFRWQEVTCSPECGRIYLQKVNESRTGGMCVTKETKAQKTTAEKADVATGVVPLRLVTDRVKTKSAKRK